MRLILALALVCAGWALMNQGLALVAQAATITVNTTADELNANSKRHLLGGARRAPAPGA
jgi:hypothetical protein